MSAEPVRLDRRHRRREETIEQVLDVALELITEEGAAGLSLGEVARRMGMRTPSLYGYFESKMAVYDALFERGWRGLTAAVTALPDPPPDPVELRAWVFTFADVFTRWSVEHPAYSQLMHWRPIPRFEPTPKAYEPAIDLLMHGRSVFFPLRDAGLLRGDVDPDHALAVFTTLISGVVTQQLANAPSEPFDGGAFTSLLPDLMAMFLDYYGPHQAPPTAKKTTKKRSSRASTSR